MHHRKNKNNVALPRMPLLAMTPIENMLMPPLARPLPCTPHSHCHSIVSYSSDTESDQDIDDAKHFLSDLDSELDAWVELDVQAAQAENKRLRGNRTCQEKKVARLSRTVERLTGQPTGGGAKRPRRKRETSQGNGHKRQCTELDVGSMEIDVLEESEEDGGFPKGITNQDRLRILQAENEELEQEIARLDKEVARLKQVKWLHEPWQQFDEEWVTRAEYMARTGVPLF